MASEEPEDRKPVVDMPAKSSMEILSELFNTFDAEPPVIVKEERSDTPPLKKNKKSKKHKHKVKKEKKEKKHKRKDRDKKRKKSRSSSGSDHSTMDLAEILIKQEKESNEQKIKIEGTGLSIELKSVKTEKGDGEESGRHRDKENTSETKEAHQKDKTSSRNEHTNNHRKDDKDKASNHKDKKPSKAEATSNGKKADKEKENKKIHSSKKIEIKLKSTTLDALTAHSEEGELPESSDEKKSKKRKHKDKGDKDEKKCKRKKHKHEEKEEIKKKAAEIRPEKAKLEPEDLRNRIKGDHRNRDRRSRSREKRSRSRSKNRERRSRSRDDKHKKDSTAGSGKNKDKDDDFYRRDRDRRSRSRSRDRDKHKELDHKSRRSVRDNPFYKDRSDDFAWSRDRDRYRTHDRDRWRRSSSRDGGGRKGSRDVAAHIDKKKLLEIARRNAIQMMKSGSLPAALTLGPQAQEKVLAAIKAGGKSIEELTDFCKTLSKQEELGELSSNPEDNATDSDTDVPFHHPFQIKDRPTSITMNIKNSVPLPIKSTQERTTELRMQFPVSSGQQHRKTENEWVPVAPKKAEPLPAASTKPAMPTVAASVTAPSAPLAIEAPPPTPLAAIPIPETPAVQATVPELVAPAPAALDVDIGSIVSQRLSAMRKLQENPLDVQALSEVYKSNKEMQSWAQSKQQPGLFTGTTGAQIMSQAELSSGYQAWAKKDQLQTATPVSGGMGMHLLQKMGWRPGEGLGKEKTGALEPLLLEVKLDKKGLVASEEQKKNKKNKQQGGGGGGGAGGGGGGGGYNANGLQSKHPVSLLGEFASKHKLGAPQYILCFECGPDHKKNFVFKVQLNNVEYRPNLASPNKKEAKALAAKMCLQQLGLLPV